MNRRPPLATLLTVCAVSCATASPHKSSPAPQDESRSVDAAPVASSRPEGGVPAEPSDGNATSAPGWTVARWFIAFKGRIMPRVKCQGSQDARSAGRAVRFRVVVAANGDVRDLRREAASDDLACDAMWEAAIRGASPFGTVPERMLDGGAEAAFFVEVVSPCCARTLRWYRTALPADDKGGGLLPTEPANPALNPTGLRPAG
jgi:hypothetical protein